MSGRVNIVFILSWKKKTDEKKKHKQLIHLEGERILQQYADKTASVFLLISSPDRVCCCRASPGFFEALSFSVGKRGAYARLALMCRRLLWDRYALARHSWGCLFLDARCVNKQFLRSSRTDTGVPVGLPAKKKTKTIRLVCWCSQQGKKKKVCVACCFLPEWGISDVPILVNALYCLFSLPV